MSDRRHRHHRGSSGYAQDPAQYAVPIGSQQPIYDTQPVYYSQDGYHPPPAPATQQPAVQQTYPLVPSNDEYSTDCGAEQAPRSYGMERERPAYTGPDCDARAPCNKHYSMQDAALSMGFPEYVSQDAAGDSYPPYDTRERQGYPTRYGHSEGQSTFQPDILDRSIPREFVDRSQQFTSTLGLSNGTHSQSDGFDGEHDEDDYEHGKPEEQGRRRHRTRRHHRSGHHSQRRNEERRQQYAHEHRSRH